MDAYKFGELLKTSGEVMVGLTVIMVHRRVLKEHNITDKVQKEMLREQAIGLFGIIFIIAGFLIKTI